MPHILEVIASSVQDAMEAQAGGADRLELVRSLEQGGLTPPLTLVQDVLHSVTIPVRVMLRERDSMSIDSHAELDRLLHHAAQIAALRPDGLVLGFVKNGKLDLPVMHRLAEAAHGTKLTFHRAFEELIDPRSSIAALKTLPQVDKILTDGGSGDWTERLAHIHHLQEIAAPQIRVIFAAGVATANFGDIASAFPNGEIHVGRAARTPQTTEGNVDRAQVAALQALLQP